MTLSDQQIERYSRQIIVNGFGAIGQQNLLSARLIVAGTAEAIEPVLGYIVGAGVGNVGLSVPQRDRLSCGPLIQRMARLNPDAKVELCETSGSAPEGADAGSCLTLGLINSSAAVEPVRRALQKGAGGRVILARTDHPGRIAIVPVPPPCALCSGDDLLAAFGDPAPMADIVSMLAVVETLKQIARGPFQREPTLTELDSAESKIRPLKPAATSGCHCSGSIRSGE